jgi:hypothetical protein
LSPRVGVTMWSYKVASGVGIWFPVTIRYAYQSIFKLQCRKAVR